MRTHGFVLLALLALAAIALGASGCLPAPEDKSSGLSPAEQVSQTQASTNLAQTNVNQTQAGTNAALAQANTAWAEAAKAYAEVARLAVEEQGSITRMALTQAFMVQIAPYGTVCAIGVGTTVGLPLLFCGLVLAYRTLTRRVQTQRAEYLK
jgi:hypothetical protein